MTAELVAETVDRALLRYDRQGDEHYDVISAFIKSVRGSDVDAALHYLARMIEAGEDPRFIARRIIILASEDIGMADPQALVVAVAAADAVQLIGMPEGRIPLAQAVVHLSLRAEVERRLPGAGRGDSGCAGRQDGQGSAAPARRPLLGAKKLGHGKGYQYPHDDELGVVAAAIPARRTAGHAVLHTDGTRQRARRRCSAGEAARDRPRHLAPGLSDIVADANSGLSRTAAATTRSGWEASFSRTVPLAHPSS